MSDLDVREKRFKKRKRNEIAKVLYENKGAFGMKVINPKKQQYKRVRMRPQDVELTEEDGEDDCMFKENGTLEERIEDLLNYYMVDNNLSFEEVLEYFDLTPLDIFLNAFYSGLIDEDDLDKLPENL